MEFNSTVLVVDDNIVNQKVINAMLTRMEIISLYADNGKQAISIWREHDIDLILMDCQMPIMDGYLATKAIRFIESGQSMNATPIVALTANVMESDRKKCLDAGMDDFLAKPVVIGILQDILQKWLVANECDYKKNKNSITEKITEQSDVYTEFTIISEHKTQLLDKHKIAQLVELMGSAFSDLIHSYIETSDQKLTDLQHAYETMNNTELHKIAHSLKGTSSNIGADQMQLLSSQIELHSKQNQLDKIGDLIDDLLHAFKYTKDELRIVIENSS